jgi:lipopolysaccharide transport system ATP-binding protein
LLNPRSAIRNPKSSEEDFWALRDVSFEVREGEVVGIVGRNGAGKSTLLKILSRITEPTKGRITLRGRVASLLEVGTGFHPELTGRENVFLNGAVLGMTRAEIRSKFDEIVSFSEVEKFLDTPVKRYSSGMQMRLAFAVAAHLEPEILIVDEVLAVGDAEFQRRCLGKMNEVCESGRTVIFVSHNMQAVRQLCEHAVWLEKGQVRSIGRSEDIVEQYLTAERKSDSITEINAEIAAAPLDPVFRMRQVDILQDGVSSTQLVTGKPVDVRFTYDVLQDTRGLHVCFSLCDMDGTMIFESLHNGADAETPPLVRAGSYVSTAVIPADFLAGRIYELQILAAIHSVRAFFKKPLSISLHVHHAGIVNRAYAGYETPGKVAPLIQWRTEPA